MRVYVLIFFSLCASILHAATVNWTDGGAGSNWSTQANWDTGFPNIADDVIIAAGESVFWDVSAGGVANSPGSGNLPERLNIDLDGSLTANSTLRLNRANINVASGAFLGGDNDNRFIDFNNASVTFDSGATTNGTWEPRNTDFTFNLDSSGFTTLVADRLFIGGAVTEVNTSSFTVNMSSYTGGSGTIDLVDFSSNNDGLTDALFQTATLDTGTLPAHVTSAALQFNETDFTIELVITAVPEPSSFALLAFGLCSLFVRRRRNSFSAQR